jgi:ketol-acid reductoisomerase
MKKVLEEIQSGYFAEEWQAVYKKSGKNSFEGLMNELSRHKIESVGAEMRKSMWKE